MPKKVGIMDIRDIIRRIKISQPIRAIYRETGVNRDKIREIKNIAKDKGWLSKEGLPSESELNKIFNSSKQKDHPLDQFKEKIKEWIKAGYSFVVITRMLLKFHSIEYNEITVRRYVKEHYPKERKPVIRRTFEVGDTAEVDFGYFGIMYDENTKRNRKTWFFSMRLNYSRKAYREIVFDQHADVFFKCHIHAFEYFGGVPKKVVCDNLKAAVIKACIHEPLVNRAYRMLAEYYGFLISPCIAGCPEHKGGVEKDVDYVKRNFMPYFRESQKQIGRDVPYASDCTRELEKWTKEIDDPHVIRGVGFSPYELFAEESEILQPVKFERWDMVTWYKRKVRDNWSIEIGKSYYSVPYRLIGKEVFAYCSSTDIVIFFEYEEIARHKKASKPFEPVKKLEHAPPNEEEYLKTTSRGVRFWAESIGLSVIEYITKLLDRKGIDGLRPARGICALSKEFGKGRLDAACKRALYYGLSGYQSVKNILVKGLDTLPLDKTMPEQFDLPFEKNAAYKFARSGSYYE
jgi:transposase